MTDVSLKTLEERIRDTAVQKLVARIATALQPIRMEIASAQRQIEIAVPILGASFTTVNANTVLAQIEKELVNVLSSGEADRMVVKLARKIADLPDDFLATDEVTK